MGDRTSPTEADFKTIVEKMTAHFQPEPSDIVQRFRFHTQVRQSHESVATYVAQLKQIAENCNFGDAVRVNEMLRDRLVCGIANEKWQQRLLAEDGLSYDKAQKLLLSLEAAEKGINDLAGDLQRKCNTSSVEGNRETPQRSPLTTRPSIVVAHMIL